MNIYNSFYHLRWENLYVLIIIVLLAILNGLFIIISKLNSITLLLTHYTHIIVHYNKLKPIYRLLHRLHHQSSILGVQVFRFRFEYLIFVVCEATSNIHHPTLDISRISSVSLNKNGETCRCWEVDPSTTSRKVNSFCFLVLRIQPWASHLPEKKTKNNSESRF